MAEKVNSPRKKLNGAGFASPFIWLSNREIARERLLAAVGVGVFLAGSVEGRAGGYDWLLTGACVVISLLFGVEYALRLRREANPLEWMVTGPAIIDLLAVLPVPLALIFGADGEIAETLRRPLVAQTHSHERSLRAARARSSQRAAIADERDDRVLRGRAVRGDVGFRSRTQGTSGGVRQFACRTPVGGDTITTTGYGDKIP